MKLQRRHTAHVLVVLKVHIKMTNKKLLWFVNDDSIPFLTINILGKKFTCFDGVTVLMLVENLETKIHSKWNQIWDTVALRNYVNNISACQTKHANGLIGWVSEQLSMWSCLCYQLPFDVYATVNWLYSIHNLNNSGLTWEVENAVN